MGKGIKIALEGYDAFEDTDPNHFSLYVDDDDDDDNVLIKEKLVGTVTVSGSQTIAHNLEYVPFCLVFAEVSAGEWRKVFGTPLDGVGGSFEIDDTNLTLYGNYKFAYHIFYDKIE